LYLSTARIKPRLPSWIRSKLRGNPPGFDCGGGHRGYQAGWLGGFLFWTPSSPSSLKLGQPAFLPPWVKAWSDTSSADVGHRVSAVVVIKHLDQPFRIPFSAARHPGPVLWFPCRFRSKRPWSTRCASVSATATYLFQGCFFCVFGPRPPDFLPRWFVGELPPSESSSLSSCFAVALR